MKRAEAISILKEHEAEFHQLGVVNLYYECGQFGLFELMDLKERAADILKHKVDIMTRDSLHRTLRRQIEASALQVF